MTAAEFTRLVEQPSLLRNANADELRELVQRYPYCASAQLLLLKKYQLDKHPDFDARLALTAAYANDRKALYRLLYDDAKFKTAQEAATVQEEQRVETEIMLGNESGAFADYTPKNQVAEIENYESMDYVKSGWAEGLRSLELESDVEKENEQENKQEVETENGTDVALSEALLEQFALASETAGGGAEINHDFDNLEEDNDDELLEENHDVELESTKALEDAIEATVEENDYRDLATSSAASAEVTHRFDGLEEENENELIETEFDAELESTKALESVIENAIAEPDYNELAVNAKPNGTADSHELADLQMPVYEKQPNVISTPTETIPNDVPQQQRDMPSDPLKHSNVEHEESPSPKEEIVPEKQNDVNDEFEPSDSLAELLQYEDDDEQVSEGHANVDTLNIDQTTSENSLTNTETFHQGVDKSLDEADAVLQTLNEEANLPTSLDEHEITSQDLTPNENTTDATPHLTPRQEINVPIAEEDVVGTEHRDIPVESAAPYRDAEPATTQQTVSHQPVDTQGSRSFTEWLRLFNPAPEKLKTEVKSAKPESANDTKTASEVSANSVTNTPHETAETHADTLYDREWQARSLEMQSWTSGLPDELKVIDEFVSQHSSHQPVSKPETSVAELAQRSLETRDEFITETMAKVYAAQGKFKKAIEVTEKLMLKYPAKSRYFADLLDEYKKKITPQ